MLQTVLKHFANYHWHHLKTQLLPFLSLFLFFHNLHRYNETIVKSFYLVFITMCLQYCKNQIYEWAELRADKYRNIIKHLK